ncbi:MAG: hypothetical protein ACLR4Z_17635 [Butyricicoccaceae bacterium]
MRTRASVKAAFAWNPAIRNISRSRRLQSASSLFRSCTRKVSGCDCSSYTEFLQLSRAWCITGHDIMFSWNVTPNEDSASQATDDREFRRHHPPRLLRQGRASGSERPCPAASIRAALCPRKRDHGHSPRRPSTVHDLRAADRGVVHM